MDFLEIIAKIAANNSKTRPAGMIDIYPDFKVCKSKDLMVRGHSFYGIWDSEASRWVTDEMEVVRLVDKELFDYKERHYSGEPNVNVRTLASYSSGAWNQWIQFIKSMPDNYHPIDDKILFANDRVTKTSYSTHHLPYNLEEGSTKAYDRLMSVLYDDEERQKLEWSIGAVLTGDSKRIQKFCVLYGESGSGKSTFLNILQKLVQGYYITFNAKALVGNNNIFGTEVFKNNPLVAIQHDGDLSKISDNSTLNSIISHEEVIINEKHKSQYSMPINCFLFMGTNQPVKITDSKSGITRRLIDVRPSGRHLSPKEYDSVMEQINFELGSIAHKCMSLYTKMGKKYYDSYRPTEMMFETNVIFNFVEENYFYFLNETGFLQLKQAYTMYKEFCQENGVDFILPRHSFREELKSYFNDYADQKRVDGKAARSVYWNFNPSSIDKTRKVISTEPESPDEKGLSLDMSTSIFDDLYKDAVAQYANSQGVPYLKWEGVTTTLKDLDTTKLHYVRLPTDHIVIDFDLRNSDGQKDRILNLEAASKWPSTYSEFSKSGQGVHLHYIYDGDTSLLNRLYGEGIEIKIFSGNSSLRRQLSQCNDLPIAHISSGLPLKKGETKMINQQVVKTEQGLRDLIIRNLNKEIHPSTKPSIDFIKKILDDAYQSGLVYDVNDMRGRVLTFAMNSTNQAEACIATVSQMKFMSDHETNGLYSSDSSNGGDLVFYDVEVFPNLFIVVYKIRGEGHKPVVMINPTANELEELFHFKLIGFNNRRYDNHILYARYIGYNNEQLFHLSSKIVSSEGSRHLFREAYNISYTDVYDFSNKKQSLKKFGIELGLHHNEFALPWDEPVPEEKWAMAAEYCTNDVIITEATFEDRKADWTARLILAELTGMTPNNSTNQLVTKLIFGEDKNPELVYTDLSETFPGYKWTQGEDNRFRNMYRGDDIGFGGYVYAEPGIHYNVAMLDVASMHPTSLIQMNYFGKYTKNYCEIKEARIAIKHGDTEVLKTIFGGRLFKYLKDPEIMDDLSYALKIALNSTYGLTSARFENIMKHPKNVNNIVALRGALFMRTLQDEVQAKGYRVAHIKTDSIKIPNADQSIIDFCKEFAKKYGYEFEHEATYEKMCLVNDAVYIAKYSYSNRESNIGKWTATGAQFQHPYVFKTLFSKEPVTFKDLCEVRTVTGDSALYLDLNEGLGDEEHNYHFVGRAGEFCPIISGGGGGILYRRKDDKYYAATGTKGYRWLECEVVQNLNAEVYVDYGYFNELANEAIDTISKFGDFDQFAEKQ